MRSSVVTCYVEKHSGVETQLTVLTIRGLLSFRKLGGWRTLSASRQHSNPRVPCLSRFLRNDALPLRALQDGMRPPITADVSEGRATKLLAAQNVIQPGPPFFAKNAKKSRAPSMGRSLPPCERVRHPPVPTRASDSQEPVNISCVPGFPPGATAGGLATSGLWGTPHAFLEHRQRSRSLHSARSFAFANDLAAVGMTDLENGRICGLVVRLLAGFPRLYWKS